MKSLAAVLGTACVVAMGVLAVAQTPAPQPGAPAAAPKATPPATTPAYAYNPEGRRDPFVSLLRRGGDAGRGQGPQGKLLEGTAAMLVNELVLKGIMRSGGQHVALVQGPDTKTYIVRVNDRLLDGSVRAITADTLVLMQDVNDPLSPTKQREVRRTLRAAVEPK
jgi:Tfp pilus assembly protein PilP